MFERYKSKTLLISKEKKFIFIHNYKVAGTSVRKILSDYQSESYRFLSNLLWFSIKDIRDKHKLTLSKHADYRKVEAVFGTSLNEFKLFGFVRNPWDWEVSKYEYMVQNKEHFQHKLAASFQSFDEYLAWRTTEFRTQSSFFKDSEGKLFSGNILKIENKNEVNAYLSSLVGKSISLPESNTTSRKPYQEYYDTKDMIEIIEKLYQEDIEKFSYSF